MKTGEGRIECAGVCQAGFELAAGAACANRLWVGGGAHPLGTARIAKYLTTQATVVRAMEKTKLPLAPRACFGVLLPDLSQVVRPFSLEMYKPLC